MSSDYVSVNCAITSSKELDVMFFTLPCSLSLSLCLEGERGPKLSLSFSLSSFLFKERGQKGPETLLLSLYLSYKWGNQ